MMPIARLKKEVLKLVVRSGENVKRTSVLSGRDRETKQGRPWREFKNKATLEFTVVGVPYSVEVKGTGTTVMAGDWKVVRFTEWPDTAIDGPVTRRTLQNMAQIMKGRIRNAAQ